MNSEVKEFYSNRNVLITGGSGFVGKVLIEKLLRTCNDIGNLYLLLREKKGKTPTERGKELFNDDIFVRLKEEVPDFLNKVHLIDGDCSKKGLGLTPKDRQFLIDEINIVFHCAASLNMDSKLKEAVQTNLEGVMGIIELSHEIKNLKSCMFVSTAYSNARVNKIVEEKIYDPPIEPETLVRLTEELEDSVLDNITPGLLNESPNTYCYTKSVAEDLFRKKTKNLPSGIFRPSIILPTYHEPIKGWTSSIYGPVGLILAIGLGVLRVVLCDKNVKPDIVPVDFCVNALICAAWEVHEERNNRQDSEIPVYNYTGYTRTFTWGTFQNFCLNKFKYPLTHTMWAPFTLLVTNRFLFNVLWILLHTIPGYLTDFYLSLKGKKPRLMKGYDKIMKVIKVLEIFSNTEWEFVHDNIDKLLKRLKDEDKKLFPFDMELVDYSEYYLNMCTGIKIYLLKESLDNYEADKRHYERLIMIHNIVKYVLISIFLGVCYLILNCLYNLFK